MVGSAGLQHAFRGISGPEIQLSEACIPMGVEVHGADEPEVRRVGLNGDGKASAGPLVWSARIGDAPSAGVVPIAPPKQPDEPPRVAELLLPGPSAETVGSSRAASAHAILSIDDSSCRVKPWNLNSAVE